LASTREHQEFGAAAQLIPQTEILITTPFHPGYLTAELFEKAKKLKLAVTAGVGSE
jgi:formate dehydrogenase